MTSGISDEEIRVAAYYLWEKEGRPEGVEFDFWVRAKNELAKKVEPKTAAPAAKKVVETVVAPEPAKKTTNGKKKR